MESRLPKVVLVTRKYDCPELATAIPALVNAQLEKIFNSHDVPPASRVGVCAGSRGIDNLRDITRSAVDFVREKGHTPVILPAMGSHGGATAQGQLQMLADESIGITDQSMDCEIDAAMDTVLVDDSGQFPVYWARSAMECDFILLINRIKVHTDVFGTPEGADIGMEIEGCVHSGLMKMLTVGLGKREGARIYHAQVPTRLGLGGAVTIGARMLIESSAARDKGKVLGGLAIVDNSFDKTAVIEGIPFDSRCPQDAFSRELALLEKANAWMPRLPVDKLDVLWVGQMGKRISGTGMDTNLVNRSPYGYYPGQRWRAGGPSVYSVVCSGLQSSSHGNAHGVGLADFITERLAGVINQEATTLNSLTAFAPMMCSRPPVMRNDREAILAAISCSPAVNLDQPDLAAIPDTLHPGEALISAKVLGRIDRDDFDFPLGEKPAEIDFDEHGYLVWPKRWHEYFAVDMGGTQEEKPIPGISKDPDSRSLSRSPPFRSPPTGSVDTAPCAELHLFCAELHLQADRFRAYYMIGRRERYITVPVLPQISRFSTRGRRRWQENRKEQQL